MLVRQADAINSKYGKLQSEIDSLKSILKVRIPPSNCDSLSNILIELSKKPTFLYYYKNQVYGLDLRPYTIRMTSNGKIK